MQSIFTPAVTSSSWTRAAFAGLIVLLWVALDWRLLAGGASLSPTYDGPHWRDSETGLPTHGAWDFEAHVYKLELVRTNFPHVSWDDRWYGGFPMFRYYPLLPYLALAAAAEISQAESARVLLLAITVGHLAAVLATYLLGLRLAGSAAIGFLGSLFLLTSRYCTLRSYGWEPLTICFLCAFPIGLMCFLSQPSQPLRLPVLASLSLAYLLHPLLWLCLVFAMAATLAFLAWYAALPSHEFSLRPLVELAQVVACGLLLCGFQFWPQLTYAQATSGAHLGLSYLPDYHRVASTLSPRELFLDWENLKGPGACAVVVLAAAMTANIDRRLRQPSLDAKISTAPAIAWGLLVFLYVAEWARAFPMNIASSTQYHRVIPEIIILGAAAIASFWRSASARGRVAIALMTIGGVCAGVPSAYDTAAAWRTAPDLSDAPELAVSPGPGRLSMPYTNQSLAVRASMLGRPEVFGYFEQGVTNSYVDELFSVSSGYASAIDALLYLRAFNVTEVYVNRSGGSRDRAMRAVLTPIITPRPVNDRYDVFPIPVTAPSQIAILDGSRTNQIERLAPGCRVIKNVSYCGSLREEFTGEDDQEKRFLRSYVELVDMPARARATFVRHRAGSYEIRVDDALASDAVLVKMTFDRGFDASINGKAVPIMRFGPDFMLIHPAVPGPYTVVLRHRPAPPHLMVYLASALLGLGYYVRCRRAHGRKSPRWWLADAMDEAAGGAVQGGASRGFDA